MKITFLTPAGTEDPFFRKVIRAVECAAAALGVEAVSKSCRRGEIHLYPQLARDLIASADVGDCLLFVNEAEAGAEIIPAADARDLPVCSVLQGYSAAVRMALGRPGEHHSSWILDLVPDDERAGRDLLATLVGHVLRKSSVGKPIRVLALSGPYTQASMLRLKGMRSSLADLPEVTLDGPHQAGWSRDRSRYAVLDALAEGGLPDLVWAASDSMAFGAIDALKESGLRPGRDVVVGGVDWADSTLDAIRNGEMLVSMGGHLFDAALALVFAVSALHGSARRNVSLHSEMAPLTGATMAEYATLLDDQNWPKMDWANWQLDERAIRGATNGPIWQSLLAPA